MKNRLKYLDAISGVMIVHMIAFHIFQAGKPGISANIMSPLSFFMFWFFYKSGMMNDGKKDCRVIIGNGFRKLLIPYFIFNVIGYVIWSAKQLQLGFCLEEIGKKTIYDFCYSATLPGNIALWFLPTLLVVQVLFCLARLAPPENKERRFSIFVLLLVFCYYIRDERFFCPCYIKNISLGLAAYIFGFVLKDKQNTLFVLCLSCMTYVAVLLFYPSSINFMENKIINGNYVLAIMYSFAGCILINNIMMRFFPNGINVLNYIGKKSMDYYAPHMIVLTLCLFTPLCLVPYIKILQCCMCIVILPLISEAVERFGVEWIFGRKNIKKK